MKTKNVMKPLTIPQATSQARRLLDKLMPGQMTTAESRYSHDLKDDVALVITTITFPPEHQNRMGLRLALESLKGFRVLDGDWGHFRVTRAR